MTAIEPHAGQQIGVFSVVFSVVFSCVFCVFSCVFCVFWLVTDASHTHFGVSDTHKHPCSHL